MDETKLTLAKEIKVIMPDVADDIITSKIERAHRAPQKETNQYSTQGPLPIIDKFIDWNFQKKIKSNLIKAAKDQFKIRVQFKPMSNIYVKCEITM